MLKEEFRKREELELTTSVHQKHLHHDQNQVNELKRENVELETYDRGLCVRVDGIPSVENDASDKVLDKVLSFNARSGI